MNNSIKTYEDLLQEEQRLLQQLKAQEVLIREDIAGLKEKIKPMEKARYKNLVDVLDEMNITETSKYAIVDVDPRDEKLVLQAK